LAEEQTSRSTWSAILQQCRLAKGAVDWDQPIAMRLGGDDDDDDGHAPAVTKTFAEWISEVESILLNPNATYADLVRAGDIANRINELDEDTQACRSEDDEDHDEDDGDDDEDGNGHDDDIDDESGKNGKSDDAKGNKLGKDDDKSGKSGDGNGKKGKGGK
jgi:hypothetical protein